MTVHEEKPTPQVLGQRIRNRIMEYLETASSFDEQRAYQAAVPWVHVPNEIIEQWADWVHDPRSPIFTTPVFSPPEQEAIARFQVLWERVIRDTPNPLPSLEVLFEMPEWILLRDMAKKCLEVFGPRGKFPEDHPFDE